MPISRRLLMHTLLAAMLPAFARRGRVLKAYWLIGAERKRSLAEAQHYESYPSVLIAEVAAQPGEDWLRLGNKWASPFSVAFFVTYKKDSVWVTNPRDIWRNKPIIERVDAQAGRLELYFYRWWQRNSNIGAHRRSYFYLPAARAEVVRLLENPRGTISIQRTAWPPEEDLAFLRSLLPELLD